MEEPFVESPYIEIIETKEHEDGSATFTFQMDHETTITFAKIGLLKVLTDEAKRVVEEDEAKRMMDENESEDRAV